MTVQQQFIAANEYAQLWRALMPDLTTPDQAQLLQWAGKYSHELVSRGINRAACKARKLRDTASPMSAFEATKYAASVMKNESLGIRRFEQKKG
jgi:hypothetical protein